MIELIATGQQGDQKALNSLFNLYYNDVYYFAMKTLRDEKLAYDITQETFIRIIQSLREQEEPAAFQTWIRQITYHQCTHYFKRKRCFGG